MDYSTNLAAASGVLNGAQGIKGLVNSILGIINAIIPVLVTAAFVFFMWGVVQYIYSRGKGNKRNMIVWSLGVIFVLLSVWGIIRVLQDSVFNASSPCNTADCGAGYFNPGPGATTPY